MTINEISFAKGEKLITKFYLTYQEVWSFSKCTQIDFETNVDFLVEKVC